MTIQLSTKSLIFPINWFLLMDKVSHRQEETTKMIKVEKKTTFSLRKKMENPFYSLKHT